MNKTIGRRLLIYIFLGCIIPCTLGMMYIASVIREQTQSEYVRQIDGLIEKTQVLVYLGIQEPAVETLTQLVAAEQRWQLTESIGNRIFDSPGQLSETASRRLAALHQVHAGKIGDLVIVTSRGGCLSYPTYGAEKDTDPRGWSWYKRGVLQSNQLVATDFYVTKRGQEPMVVLTRTLQRGADITGVAAVELNLQPLRQELEKIRIDTGAYFMVLSQEEQIILNPLNQEWVTKTPRELLLTELLDVKEKQTGLHPINLSGKQYLMRVGAPGGNGWTIVAFFDMDLIADRSRVALYQLGLVYGVGIVFILLVVAAGTRRITSPIEKLSQGTLAITSGDLNATVEISGNDEFGFLANSFNQMANTLKDNFAKIQKQNEEISKREREFQTLVENAQDIISRLDKSLRYLYVNPAIEPYIGVLARDFINKTNWEIAFPAEFCLPLEECYHKVFRTGRDLLIELEFPGFDNNSLYFQAHVIPEFDRYGRVETVLSVMRNITERKEMEKNLARLDRLNLVGEMAAGIAHEVRNPMTTVRGYLQMLGRKNELTEYQSHFQMMIDELDRANGIITEFLALAKNKRVDLQVANLNGIILNLQPLIQADAYMADKLTEWELNEIPPLLIDEKEIRQLILNLARNGLEAMQPGGCLLVKTYVDEGETILSIEDQGRGIRPEILEKIGIPFMTTKDNGTGLGLAVCYSIAARHHARIQIQTSSEGTAVSVHFSRATR